MAPLKIHVTGEGQITRPAERAILILDAYSQQLSTAEEASAVVTATTVTIRDHIAPYCPQGSYDEETTYQKASENEKETQPAISHYSMSTLDTTIHRARIPSTTTTNDNAYQTTYSARAQFHIKFTSFAILDKLATHFSTLNNITIKKIEWHLTDSTLHSIKGSARKRAAQDAIQRARDYAEVFAGLDAEAVVRKVKAVDVTESTQYRQNTRPQLHFGKMQRALGQMGDKQELQFQPEDVRLEVQVTGVFEVEI